MRLSTFQLATRLETDPGQAWMVAMTADQATARRLGHELADELGAFGHTAVVMQPSEPSELVTAVERGATCVVLGEALDDAAWSLFDRARSRLEHDGRERVVFVLSRAACERLARRAPNLWSFVASAVYELGDDEPMSDDERERRLAALREAHGLSDQQLVAAVERGAAPESPDVAEWLILLGRGDLLRRGEA